MIPLRPAGQRDLTRWRWLGRFLRWKHARTAVQIPLLLLSALLIFDGLIGPSLAPKNLAGVLPWVHWRGFIVLALLIGGNLFCMACPFMLPRRLAKKIFPANLTWPRWLPGKVVAIGLLLAFFWSYEAFDLWASPWLTAWVAVGYFGGAFVIDGMFKGAAFCKHVCPIGQFNFVNGLASPLEVGVRDHDICASCVTKDCIRGRHDPNSGKLLQQGCELYLFQERKVGNFDCTFCLDCIQACPYDNVGMIARNPVREFTDDPNRSGIGRLSGRLDVALLALLIVFGGMMNAFGMVSPVYRLESWLADLLGTSSEPLVLAVIFAVGLVAMPLLLVSLTTLISRAWAGGSSHSFSQLASRYAVALAPLGLGIWTAHYGFHFFTGALTIIPVMHEFLQQVGIPLPGEPNWGLSAILPVGLIDVFELLVLEFGLGLTFWALYRTSKWAFPENSRRGWLPWATLAILIFIAALWLMSQPMEMRGTILN